MNKKDRPRPSWRPPPVLDKHAKPTSVWDSAVFRLSAALCIALGIVLMFALSKDDPPKPSGAPAQADSPADPPKPYFGTTGRIDGAAAKAAQRARTEAAAAKADPRSFSPEFRRAALAEGVKIEPDARDFLPGSSSDKIFTLQYAMAMIAVKGWRCDSISSATPHLFSIGYNIYCNEFRYSYDIKDRGGTWTVTLN